MSSSISKFKQPHALLNHILDQPDLPAIIQNLDSAVLGRLIQHLGLEDAAPIVSLSTSNQLKKVLDEDLWRSQSPGKPKAFDADRFGMWLEIMLETGAAFASRKIMELDEDLVILGLSRLVTVVARDTLSHILDDNTQDKMIDGTLNLEFGNFWVIGKNQLRWDAVCTLLAELNELDFDWLVRILEQCRRISEEQIETHNDLFHVLTAGEMIEEDVAAEREQRRQDKGFITPASAAAFLSQIRLSPLHQIIREKEMDYAYRAYFRAAESKAVVEPNVRSQSPGKSKTDSIDLKVVQFLQTLQDAEALPVSDHKMLSYEGQETVNQQLPLSEAMRILSQTNPPLYSQRVMEFSYLSNTLIAGCAFQGHPFQPQEAAEAALAVCNLGAEYMLRTDTRLRKKSITDSMAPVLQTHHLVKVFQVGWKILYNDVVLHTTNTVLKCINALKSKLTEPREQYELTRITCQLRACTSAGVPWEINHQMDFLFVFFDGATTDTLTKLLQEYPTLSDFLCTTGGHRLSPFIWSLDHIVTARDFLSSVRRSLS